MAGNEAIDIGSRRELFVDYHLIEKTDGCSLVMHEPRDEGCVFEYSKPWEGIYSGGGTVMKVSDEYRFYYRGMHPGDDGNNTECTCVALSSDGHHWERPTIGKFELLGDKTNNAVLAHLQPFSHNFMPFLDTCPRAVSEERFKAMAGHFKVAKGLFMFASPDGFNWKKLVQEPAITSENFAFDSPNLGFWSEHEGKYVSYFRTWKDGVRWVSRATSDDFVTWSPKEEMQFLHNGEMAAVEEYYTTSTQPYFRAPHIYLAFPRRYVPRRGVLSKDEADRLGVFKAQRGSCSDTILMSSRGGLVYDRTFMGAFLRPGLDRRMWSARPGTIAWGLVQTGERELSMYRNMHYATPDVREHRYSIRLDGFASARGGYGGGRLQSRPLTFSGSKLTLNYSTSAVGHVRVEVQDEAGKPIPEFSMEDCPKIIGDEIERTVQWKDDADLGRLAGRPVRLLFELKDADIFSFQMA